MLRRFIVGLGLCILIGLLVACGGSPEIVPTQIDQPVLSTSTKVEVSQIPTEEPQTTAEPVTAATVAPPPEEPTPTVFDPYASVVHTDLPGEPVLSYWATDCSTGRYTFAIDAPNVGVGCDMWERNFLERPVNQTESVYYPQLDIVRFQMGKDEAWIYAELMTYAMGGVDPVLDGSYLLELDFDVDGDGDMLIMAINPAVFSAGEWHTLGVEIWQDVNDDVGGSKRVLADDGDPGDGYETLLFDQGLSDDPDMAWARISPLDPAVLQFAFRRTLPTTKGAFMWWAWTSQDRLDPGRFDLVDHFQSDEYAQLDNTCRWIFNGPPQPVANICAYQQTKPDKPNKSEPSNVCVQYPEPAYSCKPCFWNPVTCQWDCYC